MTSDLEWDKVITLEVKQLACITPYTFLLECETSMGRYKFLVHPKMIHYLVGLFDTGFIVSVLPDSDNCRVQLLCISSKINKVHDRTIPYHEWFSC